MVTCPACDRKADSFPLRGSAQGSLSHSDFSARSGRLAPSPGYRECLECGILVSTVDWSDDVLHEGYANAAPNPTDEEAAAETYAKLFLSYSAPPARLLEIGCGAGAFLRRMREAGSTRCMGYEPGFKGALGNGIEIRKESWNPDRPLPEKFTAVACFQTLEHLPRPQRQLASFYAALEDGGQLWLCCHDFSTWINRRLEARSPIFDPQHLHLFSPTGLQRLCEKAGFRVRVVTRYSNTYPVSTWLRLSGLRVSSGMLDRMKLTFPTGNFALLAEKGPTK